MWIHEIKACLAISLKSAKHKSVPLSFLRISLQGRLIGLGLFSDLTEITNGVQNLLPIPDQLDPLTQHTEFDAVFEVRYELDVDLALAMRMINVIGIMFAIHTTFDSL